MELRQIKCPPAELPLTTERQGPPLQEAIEWVKRRPNPMPDGEAEIEIRQVFEAEDFGPALTPELREQEERLRSQVEQRTGS